MRFPTWIVLGLMTVLAACGGGGGDSDDADTTVGPSADVSLKVSGPSTAAGNGSSVLLEMVITNNGSLPARGVTIDGTIAPGASAYIVSCTVTGFATCAPGSLFPVANLPAMGSVRMEIELVLPWDAHGTLESTFWVAASNDSQPNNNRATYSVNVHSSDLAVAGQGPANQVISGTTANYTMQLTNLGPDPATNVPLENIVGAGQTLSSMTCSAMGGAQCPASLGAVMTVPLVPMGGTLTFVVTTNVGATTIGFVTNTMYAAPTGDPVTFNNVATVSGTTQIPVGANSFVQLQSDQGDYIGQGLQYTYTKATALISLTPTNNFLTINVDGDENWHAQIALPTGYSQFIVGTYQATRYNNFQNAGLDWWGEGRGCNQITGTLYIDHIIYSGSSISELDLRFEQHCEGGGTALRGQVHWLASDPTAPPGPQNPPPAGLWDAPSSAIPSSGNYVYLQSDVGDYIGGGQTTLYTQSTALLDVAVNDGLLTVDINGDERWSGDFQGMSSIPQLQPGYYGGLQRYPFHNPARGGLDWSGEGRGCNRLTGWFVIDSITFVGSTLTQVDARFEQHCEGGGAALRGKIHWVASDTTAPPGPQNPPPPGLWNAPAGATPATGNYIYLQSAAGDYVGQGQTFLYTQANAILNVWVASGHLGVAVEGDEYWWGDLQAMNSIAQLQTGYYGGLERYPFHNPVRGGLDWGGEGRGCNVLTGWFVIDSITFVGSTLTSVDARFEQHCEGGVAALHGKIHWVAGDTTAPPGPQNPPPAGLWNAPAGATPVSGNYVYLQSDAGDYIGQGRTNVYSTGLTVFSSGAVLDVQITNGSNWWFGTFEGMNSLTRFQPGYYGDLQRYPFNNPTRGGLSWSGEGRGCNTLTGWFVIDSVTYVGSTLTAVDLRFEQHCEGFPSALHGKVHWVAGP